MYCFTEIDNLSDNAYKRSMQFINNMRRAEQNAWRKQREK